MADTDIPDPNPEPVQPEPAPAPEPPASRTTARVRAGDRVQGQGPRLHHRLPHREAWMRRTTKRGARPKRAPRL